MATTAATTPTAPTAAESGAYGAAFVLPITRDGRALLARERRGHETRLALLGGKALPGEDAFACAAREAHEETGGALSNVARARIARGAGVKGAPVAFRGPHQPEATQSVAVAHDLVTKEDLDVPARFDAPEAARLRTLSETTRARRSAIGKTRRKTTTKTPSATVQLGTEFVPLASLRNHAWRAAHMHAFPHSVLVARLMSGL